MSELSTEHLDLRDSVRALLSKRSDSAAVRKAIQSSSGYDEGLWTLLCDQIGVAALSIPEQLTVSVEDAAPGTQFTAGQIALPKGVNLISDPETLVVNVVNAPTAADLEEEGAGEAAEGAAAAAEEEEAGEAEAPAAESE